MSIPHPTPACAPSASGRTSLLFALTLIITILSGGVSHGETLRELFKRVDPAVVVVKTTHQHVVAGPKKQFATLPGLGSGVLISPDGKVMTAAHVVQTAD